MTTRTLPRVAGIAAVLLLLLAVLPSDVAAQLRAGELGQQRLGRAYWHVFASYAIGWLLIFGWIVSIFRRLKRVEERLGDAE